MKCGKPISREEEEYCYDCKRRPHEFVEGRNLWVHKSPASTAIYHLKYHNAQIIGLIFGRELGREYRRWLEMRKIELIIPIPLHIRRRRSRGYNQAEIISRGLSEVTGIPVDSENMVRVKYTTPQKKLDNSQRQRNMYGIFRLRHKVEAKNVVLVDDIYTTGSTLDEAARILKRGGAINVYFLTVSIGQGF